jgi:hypothetical protein
VDRLPELVRCCWMKYVLSCESAASNPAKDASPLY